MSDNTTTATEMTGETVVSKFASRKFTIAICGVGAILLLVIMAALLQKFAGIDLGQYLPWAVGSVASLCGVSSGTIAWEDVVTKKTAVDLAAQASTPKTTD